MPKSRKYKNTDPDMPDLFGDTKSLFKDDENPGIGLDDMDDIYEIDIERIAQESNTMASSNIQNLLRCYNSKEFVEEHPDFKRRIDTEIEGLRKLYKLAKVDEEVHDHLVTSIAKNPGNASLYKALNDIQGKMLAIDNEIRERIAGFNKIISGYQLELNFASESKVEDSNAGTAQFEDGAVLSRGSKAFIEQMRKEKELREQTNEVVYEKDDLPPFCEVNDDGEVVDTDTGEVMGKIKE